MQRRGTCANKKGLLFTACSVTMRVFCFLLPKKGVLLSANTTQATHNLRDDRGLMLLCPPPLLLLLVVGHDMRVIAMGCVSHANKLAHAAA